MVGVTLEAELQGRTFRAVQQRGGEVVHALLPEHMAQIGYWQPGAQVATREQHLFARAQQLGAP